MKPSCEIPAIDWDNLMIFSRLVELKELFPHWSVAQFAKQLNYDGYRTELGEPISHLQIKRLFDQEEFYNDIFSSSHVSVYGQHLMPEVMEMNEIAEKYERVVEEETVLLELIRTCEACLNAVLEFTYRHVKEHHQLTIEDVLTAIFAISNDLRTELIHVQFEKAVLSGEMRHQDNR